MKRMPIVSIACFAAAAAAFAFLVAMATQQTIPYEVSEVPLEAEAVGADAGEGADPIDWSLLPASVVAWVRIPGTTVNYPIVQGDSADPGFYLTHDADGRASAWGTPYIDDACAEGAGSPLVVVFGHHMSDGTMFSPIASYSSRAFAEGHRAILVYTRERTIPLEAFAADVVDADREGVRTEFRDAEDLRSFVGEKLGGCDVLLEEPGDLEQVWAFATCSYQTDNSRTVVYAAEKEVDRQ